MKKKKFSPLNWLILILLLFLTSSFTKDKDVVKYFDLLDEAEAYFHYEEYSEALPLYIRVHEKYNNNHYLSYKIGRCYLKLPYDRQKALPYLLKAREKAPLVQNTGNFRKDLVPVDVILFIADAYLVNNMPDKAIPFYEEFKKEADPKVFNLTLPIDEISDCNRAIEMEKNPIQVTMTNLGSNINTRFSETNPVVSDDESVLIYASYLQFYQAVYYSKKVNGQWSAPQNIIPDLGVDGDCLPVSLSVDGKELYFYRSDEFKGDLYVSKFVNDKWTKVKKLNNNINTRYWESGACVSADGKTLYFTSNRPGGFGGLDIYKSERTTGDDWGPPVNLGPVINSSYNEDAPYLTADGKRLYFCSYGHESMGGYDIFYSEKNAAGQWQKPVNIGYPVNSTDDDMFFCPVRNGRAGYSYKFDPNGFGKYDIVRYEFPAETASTVIVQKKVQPQLQTSSETAGISNEKNLPVNTNNQYNTDQTKQKSNNLPSVHKRLSANDSLALLNHIPIPSESTLNNRVQDSSRLSHSSDSALRAASDSISVLEKNKMNVSKGGFWRRILWGEFIWGGIFTISIAGFILLFLLIILYKRRKKKVKPD